MSIFQPTINISSQSDWVRPSDWLSFPKPTDIYSFKLLNAVHELSDNWAMFKITGTVSTTSSYTVNWGDGISDTYTITGNFIITATHQYNYSEISTYTLCSRGYRQVTITGSTTATITNLVFSARERLITTNQSHVYSSFLEAYFSSGWVYVYFVTTAGGASGYQYHEMVEYVYRDCLGVTSLQEMCFWLRNLGKVDFINTEQVTSLYYTFARIYSLRSISMNLPACVTLSYSFRDTAPLKIADFQNLPKITTTVQAFVGTQIKKIQLKIGEYSDIFTNSRAEDITLNVSECTTAVINLSSIPTLRILHLIGATTTLTTLNVTQSSMARTALLQLFNDLPNRTSLTAGTITITGARGAHLITADDILIATNKNWTVIP